MKYYYHCLNCKDKFEVIQNIKDDKLIHCTKCNQDTLDKIPQLSNFKLTGVGVYKNGTN